MRTLFLQMFVALGICVAVLLLQGCPDKEANHLQNTDPEHNHEEHK